MVANVSWHRSWRIQDPGTVKASGFDVLDEGHELRHRGCTGNAERDTSGSDMSFSFVGKDACHELRRSTWPPRKPSAASRQPTATLDFTPVRGGRGLACSTTRQLSSSAYGGGRLTLETAYATGLASSRGGYKPISTSKGASWTQAYRACCFPRPSGRISAQEEGRSHTHRRGSVQLTCGTPDGGHPSSCLLSCTSSCNSSPRGSRTTVNRPMKSLSC